MKKSFICINELNYLHFLNHVKLLTYNVRYLNGQVKARVNFLFEHQIQMRLKFNESLFDDHSGCLSEQVVEKFKSYQENHHGRLELPLDVAQNNRLYFFSRVIVKFDESLQWQAQAELK